MECPFGDDSNYGVNTVHNISILIFFNEICWHCYTLYFAQMPIPELQLKFVFGLYRTNGFIVNNRLYYVENVLMSFPWIILPGLNHALFKIG